MGRGLHNTGLDPAAPCRRPTRSCRREEFGRLLEAPLRALHHDPARLRHSRRLGEALLILYGGDPISAWQCRVQPFLERERALLQVIYDEHRTIPGARCLDDYEGLAVIERLHNDPDRLRDRWPFDLAEFAAVADICGARVATC